MAENESEIIGTVVDSEEKPTRHPSRDKILDFLRNKAVTKVSMTYSGSGDSGNIENPIFTVSGKELDYHESEEFGKQTLPLEVKKSNWSHAERKWIETTKVEDVPVGEAATDMCYAMLYERHCGWQDNDGSDGTFEIDVFEDKITWIHNRNRVEQDTWTYEI